MKKGECHFTYGDYRNLKKAVILGRTEEIGNLASMLESIYDKVRLAETWSELFALRIEKHSFRLAILTDSFSEVLTLSLVQQVRHLLEPKNIICLVRDEDQEKERELRSGGLIYFGSHRCFAPFAEKIIRHTLESHDGHDDTPPYPRSNSTKPPEKRRPDSSWGKYLIGNPFSCIV